jgi:hypothetical protein
MEADRPYIRVRGTALGGRYKIADVHAEFPAEDAESWANAHLISASPDLLAACRYALQFLDEYDTGHELHPSLRRTLAAAVAKATPPPGGPARPAAG